MLLRNVIWAFGKLKCSRTRYTYAENPVVAKCIGLFKTLCILGMEIADFRCTEAMGKWNVLVEGVKCTGRRYKMQGKATAANSGVSKCDTKSSSLNLLHLLNVNLCFLLEYLLIKKKKLKIKKKNPKKSQKSAL